MTPAEEERQITQVVDRVHRRYPHLSAQTVADVVGAIRHQFDGRPIRDFVPLFVERRATAALATLGSEIPVG